jgi:hypothetical protein
MSHFYQSKDKKVWEVPLQNFNFETTSPKSLNCKNEAPEEKQLGYGLDLDQIISKKHSAAKKETLKGFLLKNTES